MNKPLCFVLMPFGKKKDATGNTIDFNRVYATIIKPAILAADLEPIRADEEMNGGIIHKPMFERLILCDYAVADLTTANANVFYELGVRHAVRPRSTVLVFSGTERLPFDVSFLRALPYKLNKHGAPKNVRDDVKSLTDRLKEARASAKKRGKPDKDSPIYQLLEDFPDIARLKTDIFRNRVQYSNEIKDRLEIARKHKKQGIEAVMEVENDLKDFEDIEAGAIIDLFLSYRAVKGWQNMIDLVDKMIEPLPSTVLVREQLAFALNRAGRGDEAETVLLDLLRERGASSETLGLLGRVYKDKWEEAVNQKKTLRAHALLDKALDAYLRGFESDWRDAYPGINAVTLMELKEPPDPRREKILPVVRYAVEQRVAKGKPDYWDFATLLELAVLGKDQAEAMAYAGKAIAAVRESWEPETTLRNLRLIREAREKRREDVGWIKKIESALAEETK